MTPSVITTKHMNHRHECVPAKSRNSVAAPDGSAAGNHPANSLSEFHALYVFHGDFIRMSPARFEIVCHSADTQESVETVGASFAVSKPVRGLPAPSLE
jgi:hypothetical protein